MPKRESDKKATREWKKRNKKALTCIVYREDAAAFADYCATRGQSINENLKDYVSACLGRPLEKREGPRKKEDPPAADKWAEDLPE